MLKILHIIPSIHKGGAERLVLDICNELLERDGVEVCLVTFYDSNEFDFLTQKINWHVIPSQFIPSLSQKAVKHIAELQTFVDDFHPNVIHTHLWKTEMISRQIHAAGALWFSHVHDNMPQLKKTFFPFTKRQITNWYERHLMLKKYRLCNNHFICISQHTLWYIMNNLPSNFKRQIHLLPNAINLKSFLKPLDWITTNSSQLNLVTIGSLVDKKNQAFLIPVVQLLIKHGFTVELHVLGDGANKQSLHDAILEQKLEQNILLHGNADNVQKFLWNATIYVHSATYEPFGLVLLEAMAAGLPVVCLDGGGNRDIIEQGKNGFMVYNQNPELFADKIMELVQNQSLYHAMSVYAQEYVKRYDIKEYVTKLLELYTAHN